MSSQGTSSAGRWLAWTGAASIVLATCLAFFTGISTSCVHAPPGPCTTEYLIHPLGVRLGEWFGIVGGVILITAVLSIIFGAGWLFQLYMDKRSARRLDTQSG